VQGCGDRVRDEVCDEVTHFGATGRRKLTEKGHPRRGGSAEGSSWW
jgi:hypothetical protein